MLQLTQCFYNKCSSDQTQTIAPATTSTPQIQIVPGKSQDKKSDVKDVKESIFQKYILRHLPTKNSSIVIVFSLAFLICGILVFTGLNQNFIIRGILCVCIAILAFLAIVAIFDSYKKILGENTNEEKNETQSAESKANAALDLITKIQLTIGEFSTYVVILILIINLFLCTLFANSGLSIWVVLVLAFIPFLGILYSIISGKEGNYIKALSAISGLIITTICVCMFNLITLVISLIILLLFAIEGIRKGISIDGKLKEIKEGVVSFVKQTKNELLLQAKQTLNEETNKFLDKKAN